MKYQQIIEPVYPLNSVGLKLTNEGEVDIYYIPSTGDQHDHIFKIIRRRFPDGKISWFEEVKF